MRLQRVPAAPGGLRALATLALACGAALGANPMLPGTGTADTNVHFFNGTFLIFADHDYSVNNTGFRMDNWIIWSSPDLVEWKLMSIVSPVAFKWLGATHQCWATDAAFVNNKFYFYVSAGAGQVGVLVADSIKGPWADPLGKPLMSTAFGAAQNPKTTFRDPCVFLDPATGDYYMIAGVFNYYVTKLNNDMISFAEAPRYVTFTGDVWGPCGYNKTDDKPFMHKNGDTYYLSWGCFYATAPSVYGPFTMQGTVVETAKIAPDFRCVWDPVWSSCGTPAKPATTARQIARTQALAAPSNQRRAAAAAAAPQAGDFILMAGCNGTNGTGPPGDPAATFNTTSWTQRHGGADWAPGAPFQISPTASPWLCITAPPGGAAGSGLTLQVCRNTSTELQSFSRNATAANGEDFITGPPGCPCWNGEILDNLDRPFVVCRECSEGPPHYRKNERFAFPKSGGAGQIHRAGPRWGGWGPAYCVAALPKPPSDFGWYMAEDYEDRHGSFLHHGGQWYYFTNDRSHSHDITSSAFRDTVGCCKLSASNRLRCPMPRATMPNVACLLACLLALCRHPLQGEWHNGSLRDQCPGCEPARSLPRQGKQSNAQPTTLICHNNYGCSPACCTGGTTLILRGYWLWPDRLSRRRSSSRWRAAAQRRWTCWTWVVAMASRSAQQPVQCFATHTSPASLPPNLSRSALRQLSSRVLRSLSSLRRAYSSDSCVAPCRLRPVDWQSSPTWIAWRCGHPTRLLLQRTESWS
eukprot:SAG22_NODE_456_length_10273_cov_3.463436_4_plen_751_part_00